jgi:flagellar basal body-associated protein FliL
MNLSDMVFSIPLFWSIVLILIILFLIGAGTFFTVWFLFDRKKAKKNEKEKNKQA